MSGSRDCPKFEHCSASICPLESSWERAQHLPGERICLWLREIVKRDGLARVARAATDETAETVTRALPAILASSSDIRHKLKAAAQLGSKRDHLRAVRERPGLPATSPSPGAYTPATARLGGPGSDIGEETREAP